MNKLTVPHLLLLSFSIRGAFIHRSEMAIDGSTDGRRDGRDVHTKRKRGFVTPEIQLRWGLTKPRRCEAVVLIDFLGLDTGHARTRCSRTAGGERRRN